MHESTDSTGECPPLLSVGHAPSVYVYCLAGSSNGFADSICPIRVRIVEAYLVHAVQELLLEQLVLLAKLCYRVFPVVQVVDGSDLCLQ